jgi:TatA/E family protein of Tat protein translocase
MAMGLENPVHLLFIGVIALLVLGPRRLPELARALGNGLREFREAMSGEARPQIEPQALQPPAPPLQEPLQAQPGESAPTAAGAAASDDATAASEAVDPAQPVRSPDAPDRGPL